MPRSAEFVKPSSTLSSSPSRSDFSMEILEPRILLSADGLSPGAGVENHDEDLFDSALHHAAAAVEIVEMKGDSEAHQSDLKYQPEKEAGNLFDGGDDGEIEVVVDGDEGQTDTGGEEPESGTETVDLKPMAVHEIQFETHNFRDERRLEPLVEGDQALEELTATLNIANAPPKAGGIQEASLRIGDGLLEKVENQLVLEEGQTLYGMGLLRGSLVNRGGVVKPGFSPGVISVTDFVQDEAGSTLIEIGGLTPGNGAGHHDQIQASGNAIFGGQLSIEVIDGFEPAEGDTFTIFTWDGSRAGEFDGYLGTSGFAADEGLYFLPVYGANQLDLVVVHNTTVDPAQQTAILDLLNQFANVGDLLDAYDALNQAVDALKDAQAAAASVANTIGDILDNGKVIRDVIRNTIDTIFDEATAKAQSAITTALNNLNGMTVAGYTITMNSVTLTGGGTSSDPFHWDVDMIAARAFSANINEGTNPAFGVAFTTQAAITGSSTFALDFRFGYDAAAKGGAFVELDSFNAGLTVNATGINATVSLPGAPGAPTLNVVGGTMVLNASVAIAPKSGVLTSGALTSAAMSSIAGGTTNLSSGFSITPSGTVNANLPLTGSIGGGGASFTMTGLTAKIESADLFGSVPQMSVDSSNLALGASGTFSGKNLTGTFSATTSGGVTEIEANITNFLIEAGSTRILEGSGSGVFRISTTGNDIAGVASLTVSQGPDIPNLTLGGTFEIRFNTGAAPVATIGSTTVNLPAGKYLRVEGTGTLTLSGSGGGPGGTVGGTFTFEETTSNVVYLGITDLNVSLKAGSTNLVSVTGGSGDFVFKEDGPNTGWAGQATATVAISIPGFSNVAGTFGFKVNTLPGAVNESFTAGGSARNVNLPAGPYLRVEGTGVTLDLTVSGIAYAASGNFAFEQSQVDGSDVVLVGVTNFATALSDGTNNLVSVTNGTGGFYSTAAGFAADIAATVAFKPSVSITASGSFVVQVNTLASAVDKSITVNGAPVTIDLPAGPYLRVAGQGVTLNITVGGVAQSLTGDFNFERGQVNGSTVVKVGATNVSARVSISPAIYVEVTGAEGAFLINNSGIAGEATASGVNVVGVPGLTASATSLKVRVNNTGADVASTTITTSADTSKSYTFSFSGAEFQNFWEISGAASLGITVTTGLGSAGFEMSGTFGFRNAMISGQPKITVGVSGLAIDFKVGTYTAASLNNGNGIFLIDATGIAGKADMNFAVGLVGLSGAVKLEVNTTGTDFSAAPVAIAVGTISGTLDVMGGDDFIRACITGSANLQLGSINIPIAAGFTVTKNLSNGEIEFRNKTTDALLLRVDSAGELHHGFTIPDFTKPDPAEILSFLRQLANWLDVFRGSDIFQLKIPFTDSTVGDALDWTTAFVDNIYSHLTEFRLLPDSAISFGGGINLGGTFKVNFSNDASDQYEITIPALVAGNATSARNIINNALNGTALNGGGNIGDWLEAALDDAGNLYLKLTRDRSISSSFFQLADAGPLSGLNLRDAQGMIEQSLHQTVEALIDAIGDALGLPAASRPQYDEEARMIVWPVDWTYNYSDSLNLNFDESLGPIAGASIEGQVDLSVELRLQFQFGFDWGASEVPRLISNTQTPVPTDGRLSEDAHFALYLNNHPEDGNPADFNFTLPVGVTAGNNSIDDLAADINALFVGQFWEGIPLDKLLYAQKAGSGLAISVVNEADADGDGTLDLADEDANGNGVLDAGEDLDLDGNLDIDEDLNNDGIRQEYLGIVNLLAAVANQDDPFSTEMGFGAEISNALGEVDADDSGEPDNDGAYFRTVSIMGKRGLFIDGLVSGQPAILEASLTIDTPTPIHGELSFGFVEVEGDLVFRTGDAAGTLNPLSVALTLKNQTTGLTRFYLADLYTGSDSAEITNIINGPTFSGSFYAAIENIQVTAGIVIPFRGDPKISIWIPDINHLEYNAEPYDPVNNNEGIFLEYPDLDELLSFQGFGFAEIVRALNSIVDTLKELDGFGFLDENLPFIDMSVSDLVDYAAKFAELIDAVASGNSGSIQDMLVEMEDQLEALFGIPDDNLHVGLESVATAVLDGGSAVAEYNPAGSNNGVTITGAGALAGSTIYFYNDDALGGNTATATWDAVDQLLSIAVNNGETDANAIIAALGSIPQWAGALIADDNSGGTNTGAGPVEVKNAIKFSLTFSAGYANSLPLNINLKDLVGFIAGDASPYAGFLDAATNFISVEASGVLTVNASANLTLDFGIDLSDSSDIKPFLYDSTGVELFARVLGTDLNFEASLGSLVGIWVRDGHVAIDGDGDPDTKPEDGDDGVRFRLGLKDNNGDGRHYFNESFFNLDNIDISAEGGIQAVLPIYMPLETIPLDGEDDANGDGWPDNYLVVDIPDIVRLFLDDAAEGGTAEIEMRDANNDVAINGPSPDFKVSLRQDGAVNNGATAAWSSGANTLTININSGQTSANSVVTAVNGVSGFSAALTPNDPAGNTGAGKWQKITIITPDFSQAISGIDLCDLLDHGAPLLVDGLDKLLGTIQEGMEEVALSDSLPLIGDGLKDVAGFIEDFREGLLADLKAALTSSGGVTALIEQAIKTALWDTLGPGGINLLVNPDGSALDLDLGSSQLAVSVDCNDGLLVDIRLKKALDLVDTTDNPIDFDIGVPGFGLDVEGNVQIQLSFDLKIRFGLNKEDGFFFLTSGGHDWEDTNGNLVKDSDEVTAIGAGDPELFIGFEITIPGLSAAGELLFLELKASDDPDDPSSFVGSFAVDLTDPNNDGKLTWAEMTSPGLKFTDVVDPRLGATADVNLDLAASFGGSTAFPRILAEFHLDWTADLENGVGTPVIEFGNVQLDVGSFIADFLAPILTEIRKVTEPLDPIIDIVTARLPVLSDLLGKKVTLLTLAETFGLLEPSTVRFIESVIQVIDIINSIPLNDGELLIPLGSFKLGQSANGDYDQIDLTDALDEIDLAAAVEGVPASSTVSPSFKEQTKDFADNVGSLDNFSFPFLQNPGSLFGLFVGQDVTLIRWDMPTFKFEFSYTQSVPIYPPLYAHFGGKIGAQIDIGFGYDTYGLRKFFTSEEKNFVDILDGFFVADFDKNGQERPELILYGELFAGASIDLLIAEAGVTGGVYVTVEFDLHDENNDGKLRVSELISNAKIDPRCIFDIHGEIGLFLEAYLEIDLLFLKINKTWRFAEITLFEFDITCPTPELAHTDAGTLYLHMGSRAGDRLEIDTSDGAEHFVIKHISGDATSGETVEITWNGYTETETGVKQIVADGGEQDDIIDLRGVLANVHQIDGGAGNDQIFLGEGVNKDSTSYVDGGAGNDTILAASGGGFVIRGGDGNDIITAGSVALWAEGGAGNDTITGSTLDDTVDGGAGADLIDVGAGNDTVTGGADNDTILLGPGDDEADGGDDNDYILGGTGNDRLNGGSGDDEIIGGSGDDWITGGPGNDRLLGQSGVDVIVGDSATINSPTNITNITGSGNDTIIGGGSGDILFGGDGNDFIFGGTLFANSGTEVFEEDGNDFMDGGTGNDQLFGDDAFGTSVVRDTGISISSFVWYDTNNDGIRQDDEDGLRRCHGAGHRRHRLAAGRRHRHHPERRIVHHPRHQEHEDLFPALPLARPQPDLLSPQDAYSDDSLDSDVNIATGETDPFTPQPDERISRFAGMAGPDPVLTVNDVSITEGNQAASCSPSPHN
ncbi:MAG: LEPR-XLL domain-containing protein [Verrucomicrobiales bacterium]